MYVYRACSTEYGTYYVCDHQTPIHHKVTRKIYEHSYHKQTLYWTGVWNVQTAITQTSWLLFSKCGIQQPLYVHCIVFDSVVLMFELFFVASVVVLFYGRANDHVSIKFEPRSVLILSKDFVLILAPIFFLLLFCELILLPFLFLLVICFGGPHHMNIWHFNSPGGAERVRRITDTWHFDTFLSNECVFCGLSRYENCAHHHDYDYDVGTKIAMINAVLKMIHLINIF